MRFEAEPGEDLCRVRKDVDADAYGPRLRGSLIDFTVDAGVVQFKGECQPADACSNDRELHPGSCQSAVPAERRHPPFGMMIWNFHPGQREALSRVLQGARA